MDRHPHRGMKRVHQDVCGAFGGEFGCGNDKHVSAAAKAVHEEEDV